MSISFFWLERGGGWGSSPLTSLADYQKLNIIQKWGFHFLTEEGWWMGFESINQPGQSSEVKCNPKVSISFFWRKRVADGVWVHWAAWPTSDVECNTKTSISCFQLERSGGWGLSPLTSPANHQKLNIIKIWAFHFLAGDRWWMGFKSIDKPGWSLEVNIIEKWAFHFFGWREVEDGVWVHWLAQPIIRSWM